MRNEMSQLIYISNALDLEWHLNWAIYRYLLNVAGDSCAVLERER